MLASEVKASALLNGLLLASPRLLVMATAPAVLLTVYTSISSTSLDRAATGRSVHSPVLPLAWNIAPVRYTTPLMTAYDGAAVLNLVAPDFQPASSVNLCHVVL